MIVELAVQKVPVITKAFQWDGKCCSIEEFPEWSRSCLTGDIVWNERVLQVATLEGPIYARSGDYIVLGVNGEIWPVKPHIFEKTYRILNNDRNL